MIIDKHLIKKREDKLEEANFLLEDDCHTKFLKVAKS